MVSKYLMINPEASSNLTDQGSTHLGANIKENNKAIVKFKY